MYGSAVGSMDFRTGAFLAGTPEMGIQSAALITMGRFYGLPTMGAGCATDAHDIGPEACIEKLITMLPSVSAGADIVVGYGELDGDQTLVLEQILVDNELAHLVLRMVDGVDGRDGAELFEDIAEIGPGGNFLALQATRTAARSGEFYEPALIGRATYDAWHALGKPTMYDGARERVRAILDGPMVDPVPDTTLEELARILDEADRALRE
jgi:trimethylamine--corrinoid protein Co-methyltransferase